MSAGKRVDCTHPRANHQHGTHLAADKDGCHCDPCVAAARRHAKAVAYRTATGTSSYVPAARARAHVELLLQTITVSQIEERSGINRTSIRVLIGDFPGRPASKRITKSTQAALLAVTGARVGTEARGCVDATGTRRRLRALIAQGWNQRELTRRLGFSSRTMSVLAGSTASPEPALVTVRTRDAVRAVYDQLCLQVPPPCRGTTIARNMARAHGWPPPLAWDDDAIDDPAGLPSGDPATSTRSNLDLDEWALLVSTGEDPRRAATRCGVTWNAVEVAMTRTGHERAKRALDAWRAAA